MSKSFVDKRRDQIVHLLQERAEMTVAELAVHFGTSQLTIRRDLNHLQDAGILVRSYGTARLAEGPAGQAGTLALQSKQAIARYAAGLIEDGETIFINTSSTALAIMDFITARNVTIVTNNGHALQQSIPPEITVLLTGGEIRVPKWSMTGDFALATIGQIQATKCILGCSGISAERGLTTIVAQEMRVNALMLSRSLHRIVVTDSSKVGADASFKYGDVSQIDTFITDTGATQDGIESLKHAGTGNIICVTP